MTGPAKPSYAIVPGRQDTNAKDAKARGALKEAVKRASVLLGVILSDDHIFKAIDIGIPEDKVLMMEVPPGVVGETMDIGLFYVTSKTFEVDGKEEEGPGLVVMRRTGTGKLFSNHNIVLGDSEGITIWCMVVYQPGS